VESVRAQIRAQEIALDGVQREAVVGSRTTLDVLNAEQELLNARVSLPCVRSPPPPNEGTAHAIPIT
jgi:outer membrane protein TolC